MIPATFDPATPSAAEKRLFDLLKNDPATRDWIALHSLGLARRGPRPYGEIDFVVLVPGHGIFCLEVKGGRIACRDGVWETTNRHGETEALNRSPFMQARDGMFALRSKLLERAPPGFQSALVFGYAVVMPDIAFRIETPEWESWQVVDRDFLAARSISAAILRLAAEQRRLERGIATGEPTPATSKTIQQLLRPDFELVVTRAAQIEQTEIQLAALTMDQYEGLDRLADNERCLFEGAAGTGKTMLAVEFARRSALQGQRTLLVCFNRLLGDWLETRIAELGVADRVVAGNLHRLLRDEIVSSSFADEFRALETRGIAEELYGRAYPELGQLAIVERSRPFDVIVVDEAQDLLTPGLVGVLDGWLTNGLARGRWAVFGDFQRQAIFTNSSADELRGLVTIHCPGVPRCRLQTNCRNTRSIGEETALLSGFDAPPYRMGQIAGLPVEYQYYGSAAAQAEKLAGALRKLLADGVKPVDIVVLSRLRFENSCAAAANGGGDFQLVDVERRSSGRTRVPVVGFSTAQGFKGMESRVAVLCDVDRIDDPAEQRLLYVAMSRARAQLTVLLHDRTREHMGERIRQKLQNAWNRAP